MMGRIYAKRNPFLIIIAGTFSMGKRTIVNQLTETFNISNILNTNIVDEVVQMINPTDENLEFE
jgi:2-phosphoglycerate kinase